MHLSTVLKYLPYSKGSAATTQISLSLGGNQIVKGDQQSCERTIKDLAVAEGTLLCVQGSELHPAEFTMHRELYSIAQKMIAPERSNFTRAGPCCFKFCGDLMTHPGCAGNETPLKARAPHVDPTGNNRLCACEMCKETRGSEKAEIGAPDELGVAAHQDTLKDSVMTAPGDVEMAPVSKPVDGHDTM